jgi:aminoglycoside phosphotransferase family enzyme
MSTELAAKLAFLRASGAFDGVMEVIETHMSWVFLTERHAFKLKKPVRLPYLDYRTIERRRQSCDNELRLGRRLASNVYDRVSPLVSTASGLAIGGAGEIVDWLVVMRRLPRDRMLPQMLASGDATGAHADALGELLGRFYREAPRASWDGAEYRRRLREIVVAVAGELVERGASRVAVDRIVRHGLAWMNAHASTLDARIADGRVVDAHGDLRPEHVCLETPPVVIDPLEFDDDLRTLDAASELAFFALECDRLGATWFADRVFARYAERCSDRVPASLVELYRGQHALTRALIALRHVDDAEPSDQPRWRAKADDYLARATPMLEPDRT